MPLACGVVLAQAVGWFIPLSVSLGGLVLIGVACGLWPHGRRGFFLGAMLGLCSVVGWSLFLPHIETSSDVQLLVEVLSEPSRGMSGSVSFDARIKGDGEGAVIRCRGIDLPWRNTGLLKRGDIVWVRGDLKAVAKPVNPISWEGYLWRRRVSGELRVRYASRPLLRRSDFIAAARERMRSIVSHEGELSRGGALFLSMAFGVRDVLSARVEDGFRELGLSHLLVVSGYQVSLVFGFVSLVCGSVCRWFSIVGVARHASTCVGFLVSSLYVALIGFEMSALRALIAASCVCAGLLLDRRGHFAQRWWIALLLMHILYPWALYELGVVLTFAALAGIGIGSRLGEGRVVKTWLSVHLVVWIFTSCVLIVWVGEFSVAGVLLNLFVPAPWSIVNCTVGALSLFGTFLGVPGSASILRVVTDLNEVVAHALLWVRGVVGGVVVVEGYLRGLFASLLVVCCAVVSAMTLTAPPSLGRLFAQKRSQKR